jgi:hypothetical protein
MADVTFSEAPQSVIHVAEELIKKYHGILGEARIAFVFRSEEQELNGRVILAQVSKVPEKMQPYMEFDYVVWVAENRWINMPDKQREALIDHELCHMGMSSTGGWKIKPHNIQEFREILDRYGAWNDDLFFNLQPVMQLQPMIPGTEVTISSNGRVATISGENLEKLANNL